MKLIALCLLLFPLTAQAAVEGVAAQPVLGPRRIFVLLFLMLGPIKILAPFVEMTRGMDATFRLRLATRAILFSAAGGAVPQVFAVVLGVAQVALGLQVILRSLSLIGIFTEHSG